MPARQAQLQALALKLGHTFADPSLLDQALTHSSRTNERGGGPAHNESLEFLGDAVLGLLVAEQLYRRDPNGDEGDKSFRRAALVSAAALAPRAELLGLPPLLRLGRGEEKTGGREKTALWANALEAVIAALYLDGGMDTARTFVERVFGEELAAAAHELALRDDKSALQELLQGRGEPLPEYVVVAEEGPSHKLSFRVACRIQGRTVSEGQGSSKKQAQQAAAREALALLRSTPTST